MVLLPPVDTTGRASDVEVQALIEAVQHSIAQELGIRKLSKR
jgi:hypothetical protein